MMGRLVSLGYSLRIRMTSACNRPLFAVCLGYCGAHLRRKIAISYPHRGLPCLRVLLDSELATFYHESSRKTQLKHNMHSGVVGIQVRTQSSFIDSGPITMEDNRVSKMNNQLSDKYSHVGSCGEPQACPELRLLYTGFSYATNCRASSTAHLAARFNSVFQSASRHLVHALSPSGG
jgi:hypothetical protein